jgi:hypothetical protein
MLLPEVICDACRKRIEADMIAGPAWMLKGCAFSAAITMNATTATRRGALPPISPSCLIYSEARPAGAKEASMSASIGGHGPGVRDADTIKKLQRKYAEVVEAGGLPPDVTVKVERMRQLMDEVEWLLDADAEEDTIENVLDKAAQLAAEIQRGSGLS